MISSSRPTTSSWVFDGKPVQLDAKQVAERTAAVEALAAVSQQAVAQVKAAKTKLIDKLKTQQTKLVRLHLEEGDDISPDAFRGERRRLQDEIEAAEKSLAATEGALNLDAEVLCRALELAEGIGEVYRQASDTERRGYNQAFFS